MNKSYLYRHITVLSAVNGCNNATCKNTTFIKVAVGWEGFLIRKRKKKIINMELTLNIIVLCGNNSRINLMRSTVIKVTVGWDGFLICIKEIFKNE